MTERRVLFETISTLKMMIATYEKKATPRCPYKAMRYSLDLAVRCVEKQIAKKPKLINCYGYKCPCCCTGYLSGKPKHCDNCGQKLDWSGTND